MRFVRLIACILIIGSLSLPLSTCTSGTHTDYNYVVADVSDFMDEGVSGAASAGIVLSVFLWPLFTTWLAFRRTSPKAIMVRIGLELVLLGGSAWYMYYALLLNRPYLGAYVASAGYCLYAGVWASECISGLRSYKSRGFKGDVNAT